MLFYRVALACAATSLVLSMAGCGAGSSPGSFATPTRKTPYVNQYQLPCQQDNTCDQCPNGTQAMPGGCPSSGGGGGGGSPGTIGGPGGGGGGAACAPIALPPGSSGTSIANTYKNDRAAQALVQNISRARGASPKVDASQPYSPNHYAAAAGQASTNTIYWYSAEVAVSVQRGYTEQAIFYHELDHVYYGSPTSAGGPNPNPQPGQPGFNPTPSATLGTGADAVTINFNLLNADGSLNYDQFYAYEHVLIHDDEVQAYGQDILTQSLGDALAQATSVTANGNTVKLASTTDAMSIVSSKGLQSKGVTNRSGTVPRPPVVPTGAGSCASPAPSSIMRQVHDVFEYVGGQSVPYRGLRVPN